MSEPKSKGMLFSGPMVRALLDGTKSQTRRIVSDSNTQGNWKASDYDLSQAWVDPGPSPAGNPGPYLKARVTRAALKEAGWTEGDEIVDRLYPRVFPGDAIWVRETWKAEERGDLSDGIRYRADNHFQQIANTPSAANLWIDAYDNGKHGDKWRPSIFMPRWASRITLKVTDVRVQRLQRISEEDAIAEGVSWAPGEQEQNVRKWAVSQSARMRYADLWDSINGDESWNANPYVWCYTFVRQMPVESRS